LHPQAAQAAEQAKELARQAKEGKQARINAAVNVVLSNGAVMSLLREWLGKNIDMKRGSKTSRLGKLLVSWEAYDHENCGAKPMLVAKALLKQIGAY
jgi:predicted Zn-dependent protease